MHGLSIQESIARSQTCAKISSFVAGAFFLALSLISTEPSQAETSAEIAAKMSLEQKVGQLMIWSFQGKTIDPALEETLTKYQPGSLILFGRNISDNGQVLKLTADLQKMAAKKMKAPLFLMVDQEGGVVTRVKINTPIPSALALGKIDDAQLIENFAHLNGDLLQALGFNINLAPVMDISNPNKDSFIGNRTFGDEPDEVSNLAMAYSRGLAQAGLMPTAKHFPGHGGTITNSHHSTPKKMSTPEELSERDLVPFQEFVDAAFPRAIMTAHLALPNVDPTGLPATYSPVMIKDQLRGKMGFTGLIMTDDLEMNGAAVSADIGERAIRAFLAGNDLLMFAGSPGNQRRAIRAVIGAVLDGRISEERLNESVLRILESKSQLKIANVKPDDKKIQTTIKKLQVLSREVMRKNFEMAINERSKKEWPTISRTTPAIVFSSTAGFFYRFKKAFKGQAQLYALTPESLPGVNDELAKESTKLAIFYASGTKTARWLSQLTPELKAKMIVINCNHSGEIEDQEAYLAVLNMNSHSPDSGEWLAAELSAPKPPPTEESPTEPDLREPASGDESPPQ